MNIKEQIINDIYEIVKDNEITKEEIIVEKPKDRSMADYAVPCFAFAKKMHKSPIDIANSIKEKLTGYEKIDVVNGYLNIFINKKELTEYVVSEVLTKQEHYGDTDFGKGKKVVVEYSSPNIAKPFGVGHLRSTVIGEALNRISKKNGYDVTSINYLGDYGTQFGKLIYAYKAWGNDEEIKKNPIAELKRIYVKFHEEAKLNPELDDEGRKWFKKLDENDEEALRLWKWFKEESLKDFQKTYEVLGIDGFDSWAGEAAYKDKANEVIDMIISKGITEISDGALVVPMGEDKIPALIRKNDGTSLYITRDIAAILDRKEKYNFDEILYVVGGEQSLHFEQLKEVLKKLGYDWYNNVHHIAFGMVLQNGKKMSTRGGKTVGLQDVLDASIELAGKIIEEKNPNLENKEIVSRKVGVGAVIYNDLKNYRVNDIEFNLDSILEFSGNTGPYLQYTYARINSLLKNKENITVDLNNITINEYIWNIVIDLYDFSDIIYKAKVNYDPSMIAKYLYDLATDFNKLYAACKIIDEDKNSSQFRLQICEATSIVLKEGLRLLCIEALNKM